MISPEIRDTLRVNQGDIFKNIEHFESITEGDGKLTLTKIVFPYSVILTQDCELAQDHTFRTQDKPTHDKYLISVIVAPLYNVEHFKVGEHLSNIGFKMRTFRWDRTEGDFVKNNQNPRYHYLKFPDELEVPDSVIDFKHYFTVSISYLEKDNRSAFVCSIPELYREDISQRFSAFLSRIALPD